MIVPVIAFYAFAAVAVAAGAMVISARNPVHSVLFLILAFFNAAGLFVLLGAEFIAMILVIVYVGAVAVLFLFVVMMLDINIDRAKEGFWRFFPIGVAVALLLGVQVFMVLNSGVFGPEAFPEPKSASADKDYSHARELGNVIYTDYLLAFEAAAAVLLVAIVAAIALTLRRRPENKQLDPAEQVVVKAGDRVSMEQVVLDEPRPEPEAEEGGGDGQGEKPEPEGAPK